MPRGERRAPIIGKEIRQAAAMAMAREQRRWERRERREQPMCTIDCRRRRRTTTKNWGRRTRKSEKDVEMLFPESHAFKVENRLRATINDLMKPVLTQKDSFSDEMKELQKKF